MQTQFFASSAIDTLKSNTDLYLDTVIKDYKR